MKAVPEPAFLERIAVVRCCGLGDVAQMTPLLQQIRRDAPQACVEVFVNANVAGLLEGSPWVDVVHALPMEVFASARWNKFGWQLWTQVRQKGKFDVLVCLDLAWSRTVLSILARAAYRIGFRTEAWKPFQALDHAVVVPLDYPRNADHTSLWFLRVWLQTFQTQDGDFAADLLHLAPEPRAKLARHIALVPRAGNELVSGDLKQWPMHYWPTLAQLLLDEGWTPVMLGRRGDYEMTAMPEGTLDMLGQHSIIEVADYMARCAGVIGNDSGLYHIALAVGTPAMGLFGPTAVKRTGPFRAPHGRALTASLACVPCCADTCRVPAKGRPENERPFCLTSLTPELVVEAALRHFTRFQR